MVPCGMIMSVMRMRRVALPVMTCGRTSRIRVTQYDFKLPADRGEHETRWNERPQTEHGQDEWSRPMARTTLPQPFCSMPHHPSTMPYCGAGRKMTSPAVYFSRSRCAIERHVG